MISFEIVMQCDKMGCGKRYVIPTDNCGDPDCPINVNAAQAIPKLFRNLVDCAHEYGGFVVAGDSHFCKEHARKRVQAERRKRR